MLKRVGLLAFAIAVAGAFAFPDAARFAAAKAGYAVCHQWPEHSFSAGGTVFPLCARCTGTYFAALFLLAFIWASGRARAGDWPAKPALVVLGVGFAAMAADGINSFVDVITAGQSHLYVPSNALRFVTGGFNGLALVSIGYPLLNSVLWKDWDSRPILRNAGETLGIAALAGASLLVIEAAGALLPLFSLLSLAGILILFTGLNAALWLVLARRERRAESLRDALPALGAGLCMALAELLLTGLGRNALESHLLR